MPEARSAEADEILEAATDVVVSDLTVAELYVTLARRLKLGELRPEQVEVVRSTFEQHLADDVLTRETLRPLHSEMASRLALESTVILRTLDALHIAVAMELGAVLATFDQRMAGGARSLGLKVVP